MNTRPSNVKETELGAWIRAVKPSEREELAAYAHTNVSYLKILAGVHRENPNLRLAMALVRGVELINASHDALVPKAQWYPKVTLLGLASPTRYPNDVLPVEHLGNPELPSQHAHDTHDLSLFF